MSRMRVSRRKAKPGQLLAFWGRLPGDEPDMIFAWGDRLNKRHGNLLHYILGSKRVELAFSDEERKKANGKDYYFGRTALEMLEDAGYDLSTLKFSIEMKKPTQQPLEESPAVRT